MTPRTEARVLHARRAALWHDSRGRALAGARQHGARQDADVLQHKRGQHGRERRGRRQRRRARRHRRRHARQARRLPPAARRVPVFRGLASAQALHAGGRHTPARAPAAALCESLPQPGPSPAADGPGCMAAGRRGCRPASGRAAGGAPDQARPPQPPARTAPSPPAGSQTWRRPRSPPPPGPRAPRRRPAGARAAARRRPARP